MNPNPTTALLPVIELPAPSATEEEQRAVGREIDEACCYSGFFCVRNHQVPSSLIDDCLDQTTVLFQLGQEQKNRIRIPNPDEPYGYQLFLGESLSKSLHQESLPDLKESYTVGPQSLPPRTVGTSISEVASFAYAPTLWPEGLVTFRGVMQTYYRAMEELAARLMSLFALGLGIEPDWFRTYIDHHISALRLLHYPPIEYGVPENQWRAGAHSDYGSLTILLGQDRPGGLELQNRQGAWVPVAAPSGCFIINIGDLMALWTNDRWVSTKHRVAVPPLEAGEESRRYAVAFFHQPNWDAEIACIPGCEGPKGERPEVTTSGAHLMQKFQATVK